MIQQMYYHYPSMPLCSPLTSKEKDFTLPKWEPSKTKYSEFCSKLAMALYKDNMEAVLFALAPTPKFSTQSCKLAMDLYEKLPGLALAPFNSLEAQSYYLHQGFGIEMLHALQHKLNSLSFKWISKLQDKLCYLQLSSSQNLNDFINKMRDINSIMLNMVQMSLPLNLCIALPFLVTTNATSLKVPYNQSWKHLMPLSCILTIHGQDKPTYLRIRSNPTGVCGSVSRAIAMFTYSSSVLSQLTTALCRYLAWVFQSWNSQWQACCLTH